LVFGRRPLGAILHSSNEPGELSQWLCHDDSTIKIVVIIIIIANATKMVHITIYFNRRKNLSTQKITSTQNILSYEDFWVLLMAID